MSWDRCIEKYRNYILLERDVHGLHFRWENINIPMRQLILLT